MWSRSFKCLYNRVGDIPQTLQAYARQNYSAKSTKYLKQEDSDPVSEKGVQLRLGAQQGPQDKHRCKAAIAEGLRAQERLQNVALVQLRQHALQRRHSIQHGEECAPMEAVLRACTSWAPSSCGSSLADRHLSKMQWLHALHSCSMT